MSNLKPIKNYSQNDHRWSRKNIGPSSLTIGGHGCLITCIADYAGVHPDIIASALDFTDENYKYGAGLMLWTDKNKKTLVRFGLEFVGRYREFKSKDKNLMQSFCESISYLPILNVRTRSGGQHWVVPVGRALTWRGLGWATNDPWNGSRQWKTVGFGAPYLREIGWLLFKRV